MRRAAGLTLLLLLAALPAAARPSDDLCGHGVAAPCHAWATLDSPPDGFVADILLLPDGPLVLAGERAGGSARLVAVDRASGALAWVVELPSSWPGGLAALPGAIVLAGAADPSAPHPFAEARDAGGALRWRADLAGAEGVASDAVAAGPGVVLAGIKGLAGGGRLWFAGLDAASGAVAWERALDQAPGPAWVEGLAASPDGGMVFAAAWLPAKEQGARAVQVVALDAATGKVRWQAPYGLAPDGPPKRALARDLEVSPDGASVVLAGAVYRGEATGHDGFVLALDSATGATRWEASLESPGDLFDEVREVAFGPLGDRVVAAASAAQATGSATVALALDATTGARLWEQRASLPMATTTPTGLAVAGGRMWVAREAYSYMAGGSRIETVAHDLASGAEAWNAGYGQPMDLNFPKGLVAEPDGSAVFVGGESIALVGGGPRLLALAYRPG